MRSLIKRIGKCYNYNDTRVFLIIDNDTDVVQVISFFSEIVAEKLWVTLEPFTIFALPSLLQKRKEKIQATTIHGFYARVWQHILISETGKKSACLKWATRPELTMTLCHLMNRPLTLPWEDIKVLELSLIILQPHLDLSKQSMPANIYPIILYVNTYHQSS